MKLQFAPTLGRGLTGFLGLSPVRSPQIVAIALCFCFTGIAITETLADDAPAASSTKNKKKKKSKKSAVVAPAAAGAAATPAAPAEAPATPAAAPATTAEPSSQNAAASPAASEGSGQIVKTDLYTVVDGVKVDKFTMDGFRTWRSAACDRCHGPNQEGLVGPSLIERLKILTKDEFKKTVLEGRLEKGMPSFNTNDRVVKYIDNLYAYLKGRSDGAITKAKTMEME